METMKAGHAKIALAFVDAIEGMGEFSGARKKKEGSGRKKC